MYLNLSDSNRLVDLEAAESGGYGVLLYGARGNVLHNIRAFNNWAGGVLYAASTASNNSATVVLVAANGGDAGFDISHVRPEPHPPVWRDHRLARDGELASHLGA